jgi:hypothetical protein
MWEPNGFIMHNTVESDPPKNNPFFRLPSIITNAMAISRMLSFYSDLDRTSANKTKWYLSKLEGKF